MDIESKRLLSGKEKDNFITILTANLTVLRSKAAVSQEELANLIGISRQTYSAIERGERQMAWSTYLSLIFFYDYCQKTHSMMRQLSIFPQEMISKFNYGIERQNLENRSLLDDKSEDAYKSSVYEG